ncbi:O-acyltransferase like protein-like isoform X1 [Vespa mandarinia]|uniref:O-acyltransferase like protein-like isoform X1 n=2 Tax=Vespa mandarinia TaxID=7446 RepID=UPI001619F0BB|nr:O-acyltransferase like protein-like isoform X1 [Vespa mandarinia]
MGVLRLVNPRRFARLSLSINLPVSFFAFLIFIFTIVSNVQAGLSIKPETVLLNVFTQPFKPTKWSTNECQRDSAIYLEELAHYTPWALKMYDASVKIPSGIITGNYKQLGNYDECLQVKSDHGISGQSCSATIQFEVAEDNGASRELDFGDLLVNVAVASNATKWRSGNTIIYEWMWCVPSSCNHSEVQEFLEITLDPLKVEGRVDFVINVPIKSCRTLETEQTTFDPSDWVYISILVIFSLIIIASTTFDIARRGHSSTLNPKARSHVFLSGKEYILFSSFSFYTNCKNLFNTDRHQDSIACLDGLRFLSICWIIYGHTYYMEVMGINMDLTQVPKMHESWSKMLVLNGNMVTDTFFLLSGVLLAYTEIIKKEKNSNWKLDVIGLYLHRYSRLTPAYAMMIGFYATIYSKFGSGPHWDAWVGSNRDYCRENWWTNLLYVNNYVNVSDMCMSQSWYLATDMQLIWLSPIFLYPMLKPARRIFFWIVIGFAFVLSMILPFAVTFIHRYTATMFYYKEQQDVANVFLYVYTRVYTRAGPYIIGLALGYLLAKRRSYDVKLRKPYIVSGWLIAIAVGLSAVLGAREMYFDKHPYNRLEASFYAGMHRHAFALAVSWIIFSSVYGYAGESICEGPLGEFLSWRGWTPLSRLTYSAYLCHYVFLLSRAGSVRTTGDLTSMSVMYAFLGNLSFTMALSVLWSLSFEIPFMILDRTYLSRKKKTSCFLSKDDSAKVFGSTDSKKEIYRTIEDSSSSTVAEIYKNVTNSDNIRSICDSEETVDYYVIDQEERNKGAISSEGNTEGLASVKKIVYESTGLRIYKGRQIGSLKNDLSTDLLGRKYSFFFLPLLLLLLPRSIVFMYPTRTKTRYIFDFTSHIVFLFLSSFFGYRRTVGRRRFL